MSNQKSGQDAFGQAMWEHLQDRGQPVIIERNDGLVESMPLSGYFAPYEKWPVWQRKAIRLARGRVLDAGCGAGRVCLYLQGKGRDVVGLDNSPLAIKVCKARGVKRAVLASVMDANHGLGLFDMIVMFGNNFGIAGSAARTRQMLRRFDRITASKARIIAECRDPYPAREARNPKEALHASYHRRNRARGRMSGQVRIRIRFLNMATAWFDWLLVSRQEVRDLAAGAGWRVSRFIDSPGSGYIAVMEKAGTGAPRGSRRVSA